MFFLFLEIKKMTSVEVQPSLQTQHAQMKLPDINTQSIYTGRYKDRNPNVRAVSLVH